MSWCIISCVESNRQTLKCAMPLNAPIVLAVEATCCQTNRCAILYVLKFNHNGTCSFYGK